MGQTIPMGIGNLGFQNLIFKRKFRFTFALQNICGNSNQSIPPYYVKTASRPHVEIEEVEIDYLNGVTWIPGRARWQTMTVTYYDVASTDMAPLWNWLASIYNFTDPINLQMGSQRQDYSATGLLNLWDGCGQLLETWQMTDVWPTDIDFGELDYSSSDPAEISLTLRYSNVKYTPVCPSFAINACCSPCGSGTTANPLTTVA